MRFSAQSPLLDRDGNPVLENGTAVTLGQIAVIALDAPLPGMTIEAKLHRYKLSLAIHGAMGDVEITVEDAALIKQAVSGVQHFSPLVVGRMFDAIEGITTPARTVTGADRIAAKPETGKPAKD